MAQTRKRKVSAKQRAAARRNIKKAQAALRRKRRGPVRRKRKTTRRKATTRRRSTAKRRSPTRRRKTTVARRRRSTARRRSPARRRRTTTRRRSRSVRFTPVRGKIYRKNPRFTLRGALRTVQQGAFDAAAVVGGKAATRIVANFVPLPKDGPIMNFAVQAGSAVVVGMVAQFVFPKRVADFMVAGGLAAPIETFMKGIPFIGPMLGDDYLLMGEYAMGDVDPYLPMGDTDPMLPIGEYPAYEDEVLVGEYAY